MNATQQVSGLKTAVVSIHDVRPGTLSRTAELIEFVRDRNVRSVTLLVVPGDTWSTAQIEQLKCWQQDGMELAGHGWAHHIIRKTGLWHRVHGRILSRDEAEHLSLSKKEIRNTVSNCYQWFVQAGLTPPGLYVPPAWAMGTLPRREWRSLPFTSYETLTGVSDLSTGSFYPMGLTGYMADTTMRLLLLQFVNALILRLPWRVTRIAIHPEDLQLPLQRSLSRHLTLFDQDLSYTEALQRIEPNSHFDHKGFRR